MEIINEIRNGSFETHIIIFLIPQVRHIKHPSLNSESRCVSHLVWVFVDGVERSPGPGLQEPRAANHQTLHVYLDSYFGFNCSN